MGDELSASGRGRHPRISESLDFKDLEKWINLVRGFLDALAYERQAAGAEGELILYYTSSDYCSTWPYIPRNLTLFSLDDYHPAWYVFSPFRVMSCRDPCRTVVPLYHLQDVSFVTPLRTTWMATAARVPK